LLAAGVVEGEVQPAVRGEGRLDERRDLPLIAHVGFDKPRLALGRLDFGHHGAALGLSAAREDDPRALAGERERGGFADAGGSPGDEGDFVLKCVIHGGKGVDWH
jgi:hypothetical protein